MWTSYSIWNGEWGMVDYHPQVANPELVQGKFAGPREDSKPMIY